MPQYNYRCKNCGHEFSIDQRMSDSSLTECRVCEGELRKVINRVSGVVFKGSGFYVTDNRNGKSKKGGAGSDSGKTSSESSNSDKKRDGDGASKQENKGESNKDSKKEAVN